MNEGWDTSRRINSMIESCTNTHLASAWVKLERSTNMASRWPNFARYDVLEYCEVEATASPLQFGPDFGVIRCSASLCRPNGGRLDRCVQHLACSLEASHQVLLQERRTERLQVNEGWDTSRRIDATTRSCTNRHLASALVKLEHSTNMASRWPNFARCDVLEYCEIEATASPLQFEPDFGVIRCSASLC